MYFGIDPELGRGSHGPGRRSPGAPMVVQPAALRDRPGLRAPSPAQAALVRKRMQFLGDFRAAISRGDRAGPAQASTGPTGHGVPPAWAVHLSPDDVQAMNNGSRGTY